MSTSPLHRTPRGTFPLLFAALAGAALGAGLTGERTGARGGDDPAGAPAVPAEGPRSLSHAFREAARKVRPAVVTITTERAVSGDGPFEQFAKQFEFMDRLLRGGERRPSARLERSSGTGFLIQADGLALTNNHVVAGAERVSAKLPDGHRVEARVIGTDPLSDLAVLRLEPRADGRPYSTVELGDSRALEVGDWVLAVGNPFGLDQTVTAGVVSAKGRSRVGIAHYEDFIQTDAAINPGNSGGPMLDLGGRVVGVATAIASQSGGYQGVGFAIPIAMTKKVVEDIVAHGRVVRGWLGVAVQEASPELLARLELSGRPGALLSGVVPGSPAEAAGLLPGDYLVALAGRPVIDATQLSHLAASLPVGEPATLTVIRSGSELTLPITPTERPREGDEAPQRPEPEATPAPTPEVGIVARDLNPELAVYFGYPPEAQGVIVVRVAPGSLAARHGVRPGMLLLEVERQAVPTLDALDAVRATLDPSRGVLLRMWDGEYATFVLLH